MQEDDKGKRKMQTAPYNNIAEIGSRGTQCSECALLKSSEVQPLLGGLGQWEG